MTPEERKIMELTLLVRQIISNRACVCNRPEHRCGTNQMLDDLEAILNGPKPEAEPEWGMYGPMRPLKPGEVQMDAGDEL